MQNKHAELFALINLVRPGLLGNDMEFKDYYSKPIEYARSKEANEACAEKATEREHELRAALKTAFLERKKEDVLKGKMTEKNEKVIMCPMTDIQKKIYRHLFSLSDFATLRFANCPCDCGANQQYFKGELRDINFCWVVTPLTLILYFHPVLMLGFRKMKTKREQVEYQRRHKKELVPMKECCLRIPLNPTRDQDGEPEIAPDAVLWKYAHEEEAKDPAPDGHSDDDEPQYETRLHDGKYRMCKMCPFCLIFPATSRLHKLCSHPALLQVGSDLNGREREKAEEFARVAFPPEILKDMPGGTIHRTQDILADHLLRKWFRFCRDLDPSGVIYAPYM